MTGSIGSEQPADVTINIYLMDADMANSRTAPNIIGDYGSTSTTDGWARDHIIGETSARALRNLICAHIEQCERQLGGRTFTIAAPTEAEVTERFFEILPLAGSASAIRCRAADPSR